jgi:hypothetical protein
MVNILDDAVDSNLQRMVTIPRELNMGQLHYHLISESQITQEAIVIKGSGGTKRK